MEDSHYSWRAHEVIERDIRLWADEAPKCSECHADIIAKLGDGVGMREDGKGFELDANHGKCFGFYERCGGFVGG